MVLKKFLYLPTIVRIYANIVFIVLYVLLRLPGFEPGLEAVSLLLVRLLPAKGCWEAPVITAGPQPHLRCLILGQAIYHLWFNFRTSVE